MFKYRFSIIPKQKLTGSLELWTLALIFTVYNQWGMMKQISKSFSCFTENKSTTVETLGGPQNDREVIHNFKRFPYRKIYFNWGPQVFLWLPSLKNLPVLMVSSLLYFLFYYASLVKILFCSTCRSSWKYQSVLETKTLSVHDQL